MQHMYTSFHLHKSVLSCNIHLAIEVPSFHRLTWLEGKRVQSGLVATAKL